MKLVPNKYLQRSLTRLNWNKGKEVLKVICQPVIDLAGEIDTSELKARIPRLLKVKPMDDYLMGVWTKTGGAVALDTVKRIHRVMRKQEEDIDFWEDYFRRYVRERSLLVTGQIMTTQEVIINNLIDDVLNEGMLNGLGIDQIQRGMRESLINGLTVINKYQAERIARTETGKAANSGSYESAQATGVDVKKYWINSGRKNSRDTHVYYATLAPVGMNYEYNTGLKYPCDPDCSDGAEVINCGCAIGYDVD
jgi:hypothetical protein